MPVVKNFSGQILLTDLCTFFIWLTIKLLPCLCYGLVCLVYGVFSSFNNISVISWHQFYCWRKPEYPKKTTNLSCKSCLCYDIVGNYHMSKTRRTLERFSKFIGLIFTGKHFPFLLLWLPLNSRYNDLIRTVINGL